MLRKCIIIVLYLFFAWPIMTAGQISGPILDSLKQITHKKTIDNQDAIIFNKYIRSIYKDCPNTVLKQISLLKGNTDGITDFEVGRILLIEGIIHKNLGDYNKAFKIYNQARIIYEELEDNTYLSKVYNNIGVLHKRKGDYSSALDAYIKAKNYIEKLEDQKAQLPINNNIAVLYNRLRRIDNANFYLQENIRICKKLKLTNRLPAYYHNLANNFIIRYDEYGNKQKPYLLDSALFYYKLALSHIPVNKAPAAEAIILHGIALTYSAQGKNQESEAYYIRALHLANKINNHKSKRKALQGLGQLLCNNERNLEGIPYLEKAYQIADNNKELSNTSKLSGILAYEYEKIKDYKNSTIFFKIHTRLKDSLRKMETTGELQALSEEFHSKELENQIRILRSQTTHQSAGVDMLRNRQRQNRRIQSLLMIISMLFLGGLLYSSYTARGMKQAYYALLHRNFQITVLQRTTAIQNKQITQKNQIKTRMFQIISHDLRSPLTSLDSFARLIPLWIEEQDLKSLKEMSGTVEDSVGRILGLVDNLLSWATNQEGEIPYNPETITLRKAAQESIDLYAPMAKSKKISLKNNIPLEYEAYADKNILATVFRNLVNNAIKYTPDGGYVNLGVSEPANEQQIKVFVKDTGVGINKDKQEHLFALTRTRSRGTRGEEGNGLGLFFCKEFIELNKGEIFIDSEEGKGTTVSFTLPSAPLAVTDKKNENVLS